MFILPVKTQKKQQVGKDVDRREYYGGQVYDYEVSICSVCGKTAFCHSIRIRQDERSTPVCIDCRLQNRRAA